MPIGVVGTPWCADESKSQPGGSRPRPSPPHKKSSSKGQGYFAACVYASLTFFAKNPSIYVLYTFAPKGTEIVLVQKPKATRLIIKYRSTSTLAIHSATLQSSLYIRLQTKLQYIYTLLQKPRATESLF